MEEILGKLESIRNSYVVIQGQYVVSIYQLDELIQELKDNISNQVQAGVKVQIADRKLIAHIRDNKITLQKADYVEDGSLIKIDGNKIELYEIPYGGGDEILIGKFNTIIEAIAKGDTLT